MDAVELTPLLTNWRNQAGPLHHRLATAVASLIDAQLLRPGDRLPSERILARRLAISRTTAAAAYDLLRQRGALNSVRGSGTTVTGKRTTRHNPATATLAANPFIGNPNSRGPNDYIDLSVCRFDPPSIITDALANASDVLLPVIGNGHPTAGLPALRDELAQTITAMGLPTLPSQLLITTGSQQALALIASELERNDRVIIEDPTYFGAIHAYLDRRAKLIPLPLDQLEQATTIATREHRIDLIHITSAVHNPTGRQLDRSAGQRLVELASHCGATLVDDQTLRYLADEPRPFLAAHDPSADIITIGSFSKDSLVRAPRRMATRPRTDHHPTLRPQGRARPRHTCPRPSARAPLPAPPRRARRAPPPPTRTRTNARPRPARRTTSPMARRKP